MGVTIRCKEIEGISNWGGVMEIEIDELSLDSFTNSEKYEMICREVEDSILIEVLEANGYIVKVDE